MARNCSIIITAVIGAAFTLTLVVQNPVMIQAFVTSAVWRTVSSHCCLLQMQALGLTQPAIPRSSLLFPGSTLER